MDEDLREYNTLVSEWNKKYGSECKAMKINNAKEFKNSNKIDHIKQLFADELSERRKVKITVTTIGDFSRITKDNLNNQLSKGELAYMIVIKGEEILDKY